MSTPSAPAIQMIETGPDVYSTLSTYSSENSVLSESTVLMNSDLGSYLDSSPSLYEGETFGRQTKGIVYDFYGDIKQFHAGSSGSYLGTPMESSSLSSYKPFVPPAFGVFQNLKELMSDKP